MAKGGILGDILPIITTIAGAAVGNPELGLLDLGLGATAGEALGATAGNFVGDIATGQKPLKALENAGIAGATTGLTAGIGNNFSDIASGLGISAPAQTGSADASLVSPSTAGATTTPVTASAPIGAPTGGPAAGVATSPASVASAPSDITSALQGSSLTSTATGGATTPSTALPITGASGEGSAGVAPTTGFSTPSTSVPGTNSITNAIQNPSGSSILEAIGKNANILVPAGGMVYQAAQGGQNPKGFNQLKSEADQLATQGKSLQDYLQTGTLPPGLQNSLDLAANDAKASIKSQYASRGMSGSSAEAQDLANVDARIQAQGASLAMQLLQQGVSESGLSSNIYSQLMQEQMAADSSLGSAISNFATAAAGGIPGGKIPITIAAG